MSGPRGGWDGFGTYRDWHDLEGVRARLRAGAPVTGTGPPGAPQRRRDPLHEAAEMGSAEVVAELAAHAEDVDVVDAEGRTALWAAVCHGRAEVVEALLDAGADPWRAVLHGWSPGRLAQGSPLLAPYVRQPPDGAALTAGEQAAAVEAARLARVFADVFEEGAGVTFAGGLAAAEAVRRLGAEPCEAPEDEYYADPAYVGVTPVPGGCALVQPCGFEVTRPQLLQNLSAGGGLAYGVYFNPKSGAQGGFARDGEYEHDEWVGLEPCPEDPPERLLLRFLYGLPDSAGPLGYACAMAGVRPDDAAVVKGPPPRWVQVHSWE